jgi:hypothetical protein
VAALALALVLGGCGGSDSSGSDAAPTATVRRSPTTTETPATTSTTAPPADQADFTAVMRAILTRRDEAYEQNKPEYLDEIYLAQCKCLEGEKRDLAKQVDEGVHSSGARLKVLRVEPITIVSANAAVVRVVYEQPPTPMVDRAGRVVRTEAGEPPTSLAFTIGRVGGRWKVERIDPEGPADPAKLAS